MIVKDIIELKRPCENVSSIEEGEKIGVKNYNLWSIVIKVILKI